MYMHCNNIAHTMRYNCDCPSRLRGPICDLQGRRHLGGSKSGEDARLCVSTCVSAHVLCISAARSSAHSAGGISVRGRGEGPQCGGRKDPSHISQKKREDPLLHLPQTRRPLCVLRVSPHPSPAAQRTCSSFFIPATTGTLNHSARFYHIPVFSTGEDRRFQVGTGSFCHRPHLQLL